jgi:hypothetical protein
MHGHNKNKSLQYFVPLCVVRICKRRTSIKILKTIKQRKKKKEKTNG